MKLATIDRGGREIAVIIHQDRVLPIEDLDSNNETPFPTDLLSLIAAGRIDELRQWYEGQLADGGIESSHGIGVDQVRLAPLMRRPRKIWGIGLNYREHAGDLDETAPVGEPASFMKPDTSIVGHLDNIELPHQSERTTGEAELGIIFKAQCRDVPAADWLEVIAGFTSVIDMTAEDILRRNPRNLTQSKCFDTFFSFGPTLYTPDEVSSVMDLEVSTVKNGRTMASNRVSNMTFTPDRLVEYHTHMMTMLPGDVISTGTPGATVLADGDTIECRIDRFEPLRNNVIDLKRRD